MRDRIAEASRRLPLRVLVPLAVVLLLLWGFVELADEVVEGSTRRFDLWVLLALRTSDPSDPLGPVWLEEAARDVTALGGTVVVGLIVVVTALYQALNRAWRTGVFLLASIGLGYVALYAMKLGFDRPRPDLVAHRTEVYTSSFPSGHSMGAALTFLTLAALLARVERRRRVQAFLLTTALGLTLLVGATRVYLGVHYPTDVFGGWAVGAAWAVLTWLVADALTRRGVLGSRG